MDVSLILALCAVPLAAALCYFLGRRGGERVIARQLDEIRRLTSERDVQRTLADTTRQQLEQRQQEHAQQLLQRHQDYQQHMQQTRQDYEHQLAQLRETQQQQLDQLREMNQQQVEDQLTLIREQMKTTSEAVLKARQEELGARNIEQVSRIVNPLEESLKQMREALTDTKEKHQEALSRLDATIQANMKSSDHLGETAERLTRALTGEVKIQGNFGELKLKQLLEDLGLREGEQYDTQSHLRDRLGNLIKDDEGKGLIPDFILHFPNKRDVIVDSKMSFTAYERYVNSTDPDEQSQLLREHLTSVRAQVDRLARKDYSKYLQEGYSKLNFVIMYIHTEGALNLALLNDTKLWNEAYRRGVLILGPQTMYMNLRILELMWTQVRQLENQEEMMKAANLIVERTQDFATRFRAVEKNMQDTLHSMDSLRITTADSGPSIITAARKLLSAGARESQKKKSLDSADSIFLDADPSLLLGDEPAE